MKLTSRLIPLDNWNIRRENCDKPSTRISKRGK